jgi:Rrf2 family protein
MNLTRQADHAVRAMLYLAGQPAGERRKAAEIAGATGIPGPFAARVLSQLQRTGLLVARAGHDGGYSVAGDPTRLSLLQVIEAMEGPLQATTCLMRDQACGHDGHCVLHEGWSAAQGALRDVLAATPLARVRQTTRVQPITEKEKTNRGHLVATSS